MNRRRFLATAAGGLVAPAVVRAESVMRVRPVLFGGGQFEFRVLRSHDYAPGDWAQFSGFRGMPIFAESNTWFIQSASAIELEMPEHKPLVLPPARIMTPRYLGLPE